MNLSVITSVVQLLPAIIQAMKAIEEAIPGNGAGEQKLAAVRAILESVDDNIKELWPKVQGVIGVLVNVFNGTIWKK